MLGWLCVSNRINFEIVKKTCVWGVSEFHKTQLARTNIGDRCAFYLVEERYETQKRKPSIGGIFEILSDQYIDHSKLFAPRKQRSLEIYPYRINIKPLQVFEPELPFKPLVPKLNFIVNKRHYVSHIFGRAIRPLPIEDLETICNEYNETQI